MNNMFVIILYMSSVRTIFIRQYSLKFCKEQYGIKITIPSHAEILSPETKQFSIILKNHLQLSNEIINKLEKFITECCENNNPHTMFKLNLTTGNISKIC